MEESQALANLRDGGLLPAEPVEQEELAWEEIDRLFSGRPAPVKFEAVGDTVTGRIVRGYTRQQTKFGTQDPEFWEDGSPKLQPVLEILTAEGIRSLYVSSWRMREAIGEAFAAAGVRGPRPGGMLAVRYTANEPVQGGGQPAKVYEAGYDPPGRVPLDVRMPTPQMASIPAGQSDAPPF